MYHVQAAILLGRPLKTPTLHALFVQFGVRFEEMFTNAVSVSGGTSSARLHSR